MLATVIIPPHRLSTEAIFSTVESSKFMIPFPKTKNGMKSMPIKLAHQQSWKKDSNELQFILLNILLAHFTYVNQNHDVKRNH